MASARGFAPFACGGHGFVSPNSGGDAQADRVFCACLTIVRRCSMKIKERQQATKNDLHGIYINLETTPIRSSTTDLVGDNTTFLSHSALSTTLDKYSI
jgi:hypothetical protein